MTTRDLTAAAPRHPSSLVALLALATLALASHTLSAHVPLSHWVRWFTAAPADPLQHALLTYAWLPRLAMSLLAGGALALAGTLFQQVLRNPLAEPLTLGVASGASLALTAAAIWAPAWLGMASFGIAFAGASAAMLANLLLTWRKGFAPVPMALAGMIVNLYCGAVGLALTIAHERALIAVFVWGGGSLTQTGWDGVTWLLPRVIAALLGALLLLRPLTLFALGDSSAKQLGLALAWTRPLALAIGVALSASVVSAVGLIGFVGLAGPALARLAGARRLRDQFVWAPLTGAALLALTDQAVQCVPGIAGEMLPAGAATALLGAPALLLLLRRLPMHAERPATPASAIRRRSLAPATLGLIAVLVVVSVAALCVARTGSGWHWSALDSLPQLAFWRVPRMLASAAAGVMLAVAGTLLQRTTGNPMASPELLGVSGAGMLGILAAALSGLPLSTGGLLGAALGGALLGLVVMLGFARASRFGPSRMLLAGIALAGLSQSVIAIVTASGNAHAFLLRSLTLGLTYLVTPAIASATAGWALAMLAAALLCRRWLDILPLGAGVADALGVDARRARCVLLLIAGAATAGATIVVGPLSLIGLMAPHLARQLGFSDARSQLTVAALVGAAVMVLADWLGRTLIFPMQMPAGVLATLIGGPYLLWLLRR